MAVIPEGDNIYDVQGTILYRAVSKADYDAELAFAGGSAAASATTGASATGGGGGGGCGTGTGIGIGIGGSSVSPFFGTGGGGAFGGAAGRPLLGSLKTTLHGVGGVAGHHGGAGASAASLPARLAPLGNVVAAASAVTAAGGGTTTTTATTAATTTTATAAAAEAAAALPAIPMLDKLFPPKRLDGEGYEVSDDDDDNNINDEGNGNGENDKQSKHSGNKNGGGKRKGFAANVAFDSTAPSNHRNDGNGDGNGDVDAAEWVRVAALDHTSRVDVVLLKQHLERRCTAEHARLRGTICPTREAIFADGLRELTRQVTVLCPERGQLLRELCDAMDQTTSTCDILLDSASQYAVRKGTERDLKSYLFDDRTALQTEVRRCENRVLELRAKHAGMVKRFEEQRLATEKVHAAEMAYVKVSNQQVVGEIKRIMTSMETSK